MQYFLIILSSFVFFKASGQSSLPFREIPDYPEKYTAGSVAARMIDGLGFRYYWATEGLRDEDLSYKPGGDARTTKETLQHIHGMSVNIVNSTRRQPSEVSKINSNLPFERLRSETLNNLKAASDILRSIEDADLEEFSLIFKNGSNETRYPFWNQINGPISDCLWHVGQVVSFRRSSGNPFNSQVSVLNGKVKE